MAAKDVARNWLTDKSQVKKIFNYASYTTIALVIAFAPIAGRAMVKYQELQAAHEFMQRDGRDFIKTMIHACRRGDVPILVCDEEMKILHSNSKASEHTGYTKENLRDLHVIDLVPDECVEKHNDGVARLDGMIVGKAHEIEGAIETKSGVKGVVFEIEYLILKDIRFYVITWVQAENLAPGQEPQEKL